MSDILKTATAIIKLPDGSTQEAKVELTHEPQRLSVSAGGYTLGCTVSIKQKYKVGDQLIYQGNMGPIIREIIDVRPTGYGWKYIGEGYPEGERNYFWSESSSDPFFQGSWWSLYKAADEKPYDGTNTHTQV